jgi:hypothetical protein
LAGFIVLVIGLCCLYGCGFQENATSFRIRYLVIKVWLSGIGH